MNISIKNLISLFIEIKETNLNLQQFCRQNNVAYKPLIARIRSLKKEKNKTKDINRLIALYDSIPKKEYLELEDTIHTSVQRKDGKIEAYYYDIAKKGKKHLKGSFSREEMNTIYRMYSLYGAHLTQREVSRNFPDLTYNDFKRILRAFDISKAISPFAPHMLEECTEAELQDMYLREKEQNLLIRAEQHSVKDTELLLSKYVKKNYELEKRLKLAQEFKVEYPNDIVPTIINHTSESNDSINLYLSDIHIGSYTTTGRMYPENANYGFEEAKRRLIVVLQKLLTFNTFNTVNIVLMGDNIDCAGTFGKTARHDKSIPENLDPREQINQYINLIIWFVDSLVANKISSNYRVYSVPTGNHGGSTEYVANKAIMSIIEKRYPNIYTEVWEEYFGVFQQGTNTFICFHGKDDVYMRSGMPKILDDKTKIMLYEWLHEKGIEGESINFVKGDTHSNTLSSCKRLTYRSVLSLYGASDYANYNFSRNSYGLSYDYMIGNEIVRGTFENM